MFGTIIYDTYSLDSVNTLADAIDDICSPKDCYGWSSAAIYCFWNYETKKILYIGLASDISQRFKQHNGLLRCNSGTKYKHISEYFLKHEKIGYTLFLQSFDKQPAVYRNKSKSSTFNLSTQGLDNIKVCEGIFLEAYKHIYGCLPPWNKINGSIEGHQNFRLGNLKLLLSLTPLNNGETGYFISNCTIRELSSSSEHTTYEQYLHALRMLMLSHSINFNEAQRLSNNFFKSIIHDQIIENNYLNKKVIL